MAAVVFVHKAVRNARLNYHDPEFDLIAQGYKRTNSQVERKQPVTTQMLFKIYEQIDIADSESRLVWGSILMGFFFLDRSSELWGPVPTARSGSGDRLHCVKAANVVLRDRRGVQTGPESDDAHSVGVMFESHKGDHIGQGTVVRHYRSKHSVLCPVLAATAWLRVRQQWIREGKSLGPFLTSTSRTKTINRTRVATIIKAAARGMGLPTKDYSTHSLRIGGACALLAAGKSDLVIRLMGRWSSWCFSVYTRLKPGMVQDAASSMIKASSWECRETPLLHSRGDSIEAIAQG